MTPDPFPNELVEAAAVLLDGMTCERCDGEGYIEIHDPNAAHADNPDGSHDEYCPDCCASGRAGFRKAAALIEQRVIDRLAGEAGENPYRDLSMPLLSEVCKIEAEVWDAGAACGVAAERARWGAKQRQPEAVCDRCGAWKGLRAVGESCNTNCGGRVVAAALAPERTREGT